MTTLTIDLSEKDRTLIESYAKQHRSSIAEFVRASVIERIEDEFDARELAEAIANSDGVFYTHDEVMRKYGLR